MLKRPRRNRNSAAIRDLIIETNISVTDFIAPLFVIDGKNETEKISSMPDVLRYPIKSLVEECKFLQGLGIRSVLLFPCTDSALKDDRGSYATHTENFLLQAISEVKNACPDLLVMTDVALDPYTSHGHDGVLDTQGNVSNDDTVEILAEMSLLHAQAGADFVAPSDMMDGRIEAIRKTLDTHNLTKTGIMAYSAKYASAYYGPFREAVGSQRSDSTYLDKKTYQLHPANVREAEMEAILDEEEGADILMVKPAGAYLDIISKIRENTTLPVAAYQVSGEYSQIYAASHLGWLELKATRNESLLAIKRAGADIIITYFAREMALEFSE
ncbi:MAG: porphobilinogen synthase [Verrucomicrobiota bacterium]